MNELHAAQMNLEEANEHYNILLGKVETFLRAWDRHIFTSELGNVVQEQKVWDELQGLRWYFQNLNSAGPVSVDPEYGDLRLGPADRAKNPDKAYRQSPLEADGGNTFIDPDSAQPKCPKCGRDLPPRVMKDSHGLSGLGRECITDCGYVEHPIEVEG